MSFLDGIKWRGTAPGCVDGVEALDGLISWGTDPLMFAILRLYEADKEETDFFMTVLQEKVEDMEKAIKRFMAELEEKTEGGSK